MLPVLAGDGWHAALRRGVEAVLGVARCRAIFEEAATRRRPAEALLEGFDLRPDAAGVVEAIPATGPALVVANHPFGGADAIALIALCLRRRADFRILANEVAASAPGIGPNVIPLSILGGRDAARLNAGSLKKALDHLRGGGLLAVFPAGEVSTWRSALAQVADSPWSPHVTALAVKAAAPVLPVKFAGEAPAWFHLAGALHPLVRTALLPRVLLAMRGRSFTCRAGRLIPAEELTALPVEERTIRLRREMERADVV